MPRSLAREGARCGPRVAAWIVAARTHSRPVPARGNAHGGCLATRRRAPPTPCGWSRPRRTAASSGSPRASSERGKVLLGSGAAAVRRAADKSRLAGLLARGGHPHPETGCVAHGRVSARTAVAADRLSRRRETAAGRRLRRCVAGAQRVRSCARRCGRGPRESDADAAPLCSGTCAGGGKRLAARRGTRAAVLTVNAQIFRRRSGFFVSRRDRRRSIIRWRVAARRRGAGRARRCAAFAATSASIWC